MTCSSLCKNCNGINCRNSKPVEIDRNLDELDDYSDQEAEDERDEGSDHFETEME